VRFSTEITDVLNSLKLVCILTHLVVTVVLNVPFSFQFTCFNVLFLVSTTFQITVVPRHHNLL